MKKDLLSVKEIADILKISRTAVSKKIQKGLIKATKVGRNFVVRREDLAETLGQSISEERKKEIDTAVSKAVKEYKETFIRLGKE